MGKLVSFIDRKEADSYFAYARKNCNFILADLSYDVGLNTYFVAPPASAAQKKNPMVLQGGTRVSLEAGHPVIVCSIDPFLLRVYGPLMAWQALHLPDYDFHILLVKEPNVPNSVEDNFQALRDTIAKSSGKHLPIMCPCRLPQSRSGWIRKHMLLVLDICSCPKF